MKSSSRLQQGVKWAQERLGLPYDPTLHQELKRVSGDASGRHYYGESKTINSAIGSPALLLDSPAELGQRNAAFLQCAKILETCGVAVPTIFSADPKSGFFLVEDCGRQLLAHCIDANHPTDNASCASTKEWLAAALKILEIVREIEPDSLSRRSKDAMPPRGLAELAAEMELWDAWYRQQFLQLEPLATVAPAVLDDLNHLAKACSEQPQTFALYDFHAENVLVRPAKLNDLNDSNDSNSNIYDRLVVIDFQDACASSFALDAVSLLKDCYREFSQALRNELLGMLTQQMANSSGPLQQYAPIFERSFEEIGLQRHIRILGTFARVSARGISDRYLRYLPRVLSYCIEAIENLSGYNALAKALEATQEPLRLKLQELDIQPL